MSSSSRRVWVSRCRRPTGRSGAPGSVTSTRSAGNRASSSAASSSAPRVGDQAPRAPGGPRWPPGRRARARPARAGRPRAAVRAARPCARGSAHVAPRASVVESGRGDGGLGLGAGSRCVRSRRGPCDARAWLMRAAPPSRLVERDGRRHGGVQRLRGDRDVGDRVAGRRARPPGRPSRSAPTSSAPGAPTANVRSGSPARATSATRARAARRRRPPAPARPEDRPHPGPHGLGRTGRRAGPSATQAAPNASAPSTVPTLPGSPPPRARRRGAPPGCGPALLIDTDRPRARAQARDAREQGGLDLVDLPRAARRPRAIRPRGGGHQILALGHEALLCDAA